MLLNKGHGKGVDWWTLGILIHEMLTGEPPFVDDDPMGIYQQVLSGRLIFPRGYDKGAKYLTKKLLTADLTKRYGCLKAGAGNIKSCKWFTGFSWDGLLKRKIDAPIQPEVASATDTSNFEFYPDSTEETTVPLLAGTDPFEGF